MIAKLDNTTGHGMPHDNHKYHRVSVKYLTHKQAKIIAWILNTFILRFIK